MLQCASTQSPPKKCISRTLAWRGSNWERVFRASSNSTSFSSQTQVPSIDSSRFRRWRTTYSRAYDRRMLLAGNKCGVLPRTACSRASRRLYAPALHHDLSPTVSDRSWSYDHFSSEPVLARSRPGCCVQRGFAFTYLALAPPVTLRGRWQGVCNRKGRSAGMPCGRRSK
jgi:hypothetical protein